MINLFYCHSKNHILWWTTAVYNTSSIAISLESKHQTHILSCALLPTIGADVDKQARNSRIRACLNHCTSQCAAHKDKPFMSVIVNWCRSQLGFLLVRFLIHFLFSLCSYLELLFKITVSYEEFKTLISHTLSRKNRNVTQQFPCHIFCEDSRNPKWATQHFV